MASTSDLKCTRCGATGHLTATCKLPFQRPLCSFCGRLGHIASNCAAKCKAERAQSKAMCEAEREQERGREHEKEKKEQRLLREANVWCWHCVSLGHVKTDCAKLFKRKLDRERAEAAAEAAKDDDARSDSTVATATDKVVGQQKCWPRAPQLSGCHYCGAEHHTARECKERLLAKGRSSAFHARSIDKCPVAAMAHKKFKPKASDFPALADGATQPVRRRAQHTVQAAPAPATADLELHCMD